MYDDEESDLYSEYSTAEIEEMHRKEEEDQFLFSPSMDSLGLSWREFL